MKSERIKAKKALDKFTVQRGKFGTKGIRVRNFARYSLSKKPTGRRQRHSESLSEV
jgi:hypothetical protein